MAPVLSTTTTTTQCRPDQAPWRKHGSDTGASAWPAQTVSQPASHSGNGPIKANQSQSSRHSDARLLRTANYCQAPRLDWPDWPLPPACVFHAPGRAAGRCVFRALSPNRSPAAAQTSLISTPRPPNNPHRLRCRPSLLATLLFTRYGTSCPVPLFPPFTCTLGLPRHTTLVPPPQTASSQPPQAFSSIPRPPLHPPSLPLRPAGLVRYCLVCSSSLQPPISPTWTCSALSIDCLAFTRTFTSTHRLAFTTPQVMHSH
jgi:hypothetical protein